MIGREVSPTPVIIASALLSEAILLPEKLVQDVIRKPDLFNGAGQTEILRKLLCCQAERIIALFQISVEICYATVERVHLAVIQGEIIGKLIRAALNMFVRTTAVL